MKENGRNRRTLTDFLVYRASRHPNDVAVIVEGKGFSWSWILGNARNYAAGLLSSGVKPGQPVIIRIPNSIEFIVAYYGTLMAAAVPVPVFPQAGWERCLRIMKLCGSHDLALPVRHGPESKWFDGGEQTAPGKIRLHTFDEIIRLPQEVPFPLTMADQVALLQYTSGSTGFPKGVMLSHRQLLTNMDQMTKALKVTSSDVFISWLPVHHDMGLILCLLVPLYTGAKLVLLTRGLRQVHSWMEAISQYRGTITAAPDLAYRLAVKGVREPGRYDLSSLRVALNASEPVRAKTVRMFETHFGIANVMTPGYGLAEATVAVTIHPLGKPVVTDAAGHVSSGRALKDIHVRIVAGHRVLGNGIPGEIQVKSPACMRGYFNLRKRIFTRDGYLPTGDIGYLDSKGNLFVLGRKKNVIKLGGQTIYADDVEEVAGTVEGLRRVAAIGPMLKKTESEELVVMAEYQRNTIAAAEGGRLVAEIALRVYRHFGLRPSRVYILRTKSIPVTANGKPRYSHLNDLYLNKHNSFKELILYS